MVQDQGTRGACPVRDDDDDADTDQDPESTLV
jgi:hypothetical protein